MMAYKMRKMNQVHIYIYQREYRVVKWRYKGTRNRVHVCAHSQGLRTKIESQLKLSLIGVFITKNSSMNLQDQFCFKSVLSCP